MARSHARLLLTVWADPDWRALPMAAQWLYEALISQPTITWAGVLPLQPRRWRGLAADVDAATIEVALKALAAHRFVVVDEDTEELLVRSFVRHDGVARQPNVLKAALREAQTVQSLAIRRVLAAELRRLDVAGLNVPDRHQAVAALLLETLRALESGPEPTPPDATRTTPSEGYGEPYGDGFREPLGEPPGDGDGEVVPSGPVLTTQLQRDARAKTRRDRRPDRLDATARTARAATIAASYAANLPRRLPRAEEIRLGRGIDEALTLGWTEDDITQRGIPHWHASGKGAALFVAVASEAICRPRQPTTSRTTAAVASVDAAFQDWRARQIAGRPNVFALPSAEGA